MLQCERYFSQLNNDIKISNGENSRNWAANVVIEFDDDPTVNDSKIIVFLRQVRWSAGKREDFVRREKKQHCETEEAEKSV